MVCWKSEIHTSWICCFMRKTNNDMLPECCSFCEFQFCSKCESRLLCTVARRAERPDWSIGYPLRDLWLTADRTILERHVHVWRRGFFKICSWANGKRMKFNRPDFHQNSIFYPKSLWEVFIYINLHIGYDFSWFDSYRCFLTCKSITQSLTSLLSYDTKKSEIVSCLIEHYDLL